MKKKILCMILVLLMAIALLPAVSLAASAAGTVALTSGAAIVSGTTYTISNAAELGYLSAIVNAGQNCTGATFQLTADIDLNSGVTFTFDADTGLVTATNGTSTFYFGTGTKGASGGNATFDTTAGTVGTIYSSNTATTTGTDTIGLISWAPIGNGSAVFSGKFDGNGKTISGLYTNKNSDEQGLFGYLSSSGSISSVGVKSSYIVGNNYVGGIAGSNRGTVANCYNSGVVNGRGVYTGGITGFTNYSTVTNCYNTGVISGSGDNTGGIAGGASNYSAKVTNCYNTGTVQGQGWVGGIVGYNWMPMVQYCYNKGAVTGTNHFGGIVGENWQGTVSGCGTFDSSQKVTAGTVADCGVNQTLYTGLISGTSTLLDALNAWVNPAIYFAWKADSGSINNGYPIFDVPPVVTAPGAPTVGTATAGNGQASVSFTAPASDGGSAITGYTVTSSPGNFTGTGSGSPITVTGLTNGTAYTFTVTATNSAGTGSASSASNTVTPITVPGAPTIGTATAGNGQATVSFTAPASTGGATITGYTVTSNPGGKTGTGSGSPITVSGLTNGTAYTFTVTATNSVGTGSASAASNSVTLATVPDAPTIGTATAGNGQATVSFTAPASTGGATITGYTVTSNPGSKTGTGSGSPITVSGLTNGTAYTFTVTATNSAGTGSASGASNSVTPLVAPTVSTQAVSSMAATTATGNGNITSLGVPNPTAYGVVWNTTGTPTTSDCKTDKGATLSTGAFTASMTGLTANTTYYVRAFATNTVGTSYGTEVSFTTSAAPAEMSGGGATPHNNAEVIVGGKSDTAGTVSTETNASGQTVRTITIDTAKLDTILAEQGEKPTVIVPSTTDADVVIGELTGQTIKNMEIKDATLEFKTNAVTYTLPASQINIDSVSAQLGSQVALKDIKVNISIAEPPADTIKIVENTAARNSYQIVVKPVDFEITCTSGDKTVSVSKFNGYVERMVAIPNGVDPSKITTGIVLNSDGTFSHVPTQIVLVNGKYYAKISSLTNSTYSVIWNPVEFKDVENHWSKDAVNDMGSRMVVTGMGNGTYEPDRSITRAEFAAIVVRALGLQKGTTESGFGDVTLTDWFNGYVDTATAYSLITGYDSASYGPNDTITREQAMAILARAMKLTGLSASLTDSEASTLLAKYTDGASISDYAKTSAAMCLKTGVVTGSSATTLSPKTYVTRAEVAVMVQRLLQKSGLI